MNQVSSISAEDVEVPSAKSRLRGPLMLGGIVIALAVGLWFYLSGGRYVETDNASLQTGQVMVSANVSGKVVAVEVHENQPVKAGDVLFRIDPANFQADAAGAEAALASALANVNSTRADYQQSQSDIRSAQAKLTFAKSEAARQGSLVKEGISSRAQYDEAVLAVRTAQDAIAAAQAKAESVAARLPSGAPQNQPDVRRAAAALERAKIALGDTVVRAAQDGVVTKVNQLQVGSYVTAARPVFVLTGRRFWVEANFKENQLRYMRLGQPATVTIDAFPDRKIKAHVESFSPGTGNSFSVLPPENATGNWVKVTQRLPVEIGLDDLPTDLPLHAGLSVEVTVDTGHERHLLGADTPPSSPRAGKK